MARADYFRIFAVLAAAALAAGLLVLATPSEPALAAPGDRADAPRKHVVVWPPQDETVWPEIVNGRPASPGEYPAQGLLARRFGDSYYAWCGGTLVGERHYVTASHCTVNRKGKPLPPEDLLVVLGEIDLNRIDEDELHRVAAVDVHAEYGHASLRNDVTMLSLESPVDTGVLTPMRVVRSNEQSLWGPGVTARILGWGDIRSGGPSSDVLLEADVPMRSDADCAGAYRSAFDPQTMVCAGDGSADTCQGDSGGPLLVPDTATTEEDFALAGVTSWGYGCNNPTFPGVYARIGDDPLNSWVHARIDAPAVGSVTPPSRLTDNITVRFSEDMDPATLMDDPDNQPSTSQTVRLFKGTTEVLAKVSCADASCKTVALDPDNRLARRAKYTVRIEGADDEDILAVENPAGKELAADFVKPFKTRRR